jgi:1,2-diacylglycerol 3-alpha-glucosyltransferase
MSLDRGTPGQKTAFLVQKIGPYHHARLNAAARHGEVHAIEFRAEDAFYAWDRVEAPAAYRRLTAPRGSLGSVLRKVAPTALVCVGYSDAEIHWAMRWALANDVPLVVCSDSSYDDASRSRWRERLKGELLRGFGAGLVAGKKSRAYLEHLGVPAERIFHHWDVVDNDYFSEGADAVRRDEASQRSARTLPRNFFLCVARFVAKKNLSGLLSAYRTYVQGAGAEAWSLVLSGSGPLEDSLRAYVAGEGLQTRVHFTGFNQYSQLPAYYGLANALVLPSHSDQWGLVVNEGMAAGLPVLVSARCGCAADLVEPGVNGFVFRPDRGGELAARMTEIASLPPSTRATMGRRSREIIAEFSLESFSRGLFAAVACARNRGARPRTACCRALLAALAVRAR